jgi:hypothetical protein
MMVIGLATLASASWAQDRGACVAADVPEAFILPDGSLHPAGRLTLCTVQAFTPVVGLHRVLAEGGSASLVMSRRGRPEANAERPEILFRRLPDGSLELIGYVLTNGRKSWSYALQRSNRNGFADSSLAGAAQDSGDLVTLLASNAN